MNVQIRDSALDANRTRGARRSTAGRDTRLSGLRRSAARIGPLATVLVGIVAGPVSAGPVQFDPWISLVYGYNSNVAYLYADGAEISDTNTNLGVSLPVSRDFRTSSIDFTYTGVYNKYNRQSVLDHTSHAASINVEATPDRRSVFSFSTGFSLTQEQGTPQAEDSNPDPFLTQRADRTQYNATVHYARTFGKHWEWDISAFGSRSRFDPIAGAPGVSTGLELQNRTFYGGTTGMRRQISERTSIGADYSYQLTDFETSGDETAQTLSVNLGQQIGQWTTLGIGVGAFKRSQDDVEDQYLRADGLYVDLKVGYSRPLGRVRLGFDTGVTPTSGGALGGTSTNTTAAMFVASADERPWTWNTAVRYTRREPSDRRLETVDSLTVGGWVAWRISDSLGLRLTLNYADQSSSAGQTGGTQGIADGSYYSSSLGLDWFPLGRRR